MRPCGEVQGADGLDWASVLLLSLYVEETCMAELSQ